MEVRNLKISVLLVLLSPKATLPSLQVGVKASTYGFQWGDMIQFITPFQVLSLGAKIPVLLVRKQTKKVK